MMDPLWSHKVISAWLSAVICSQVISDSQAEITLCDHKGSIIGLAVCLSVVHNKKKKKKEASPLTVFTSTLCENSTCD